MFSIDSLPVTEAAKAKGADLENLPPQAAMADVERPKAETKTTKILVETEKNSQDDSKDDRSSNFAANKAKDIVEFNHTTKIENIVTHESALDEMTQKTEPSEGARRARSGRRLHTSRTTQGSGKSPRGA